MRTAQTVSTKSPLYAASLIPLSREEELSLALQMRSGSAEARETLIRANLRFALSMARKYAGHRLLTDDLYGEAVAGLIKAVDHFDPERNARLVTCAAHWIRNEILQALNKCGAACHFTDREFRTLVSAHKAIAAGMAPAVDAETAALMRASAPCMSLDAPCGSAGSDGDGGVCLLHLLSDEAQSSPEDAAVSACLRDDFYRTLRSLPSTEKAVFVLHHGLCGHEAQNFSQIAAQYGRTKQWAFLKAKSAERRIADSLRAWAA